MFTIKKDRGYIVLEQKLGTWFNFIFPLPRLVIGRKYIGFSPKLRPEMASSFTIRNGTKIIKYRFYTLRCLIEHYSPRFQTVTIRELSYAFNGSSFGRDRLGMFLFISYDATSDSGTKFGTSGSWNHTVTGSNTGLFAGSINTATSTKSPAATYNSVSMTRQANLVAFNKEASAFYLTAPATGTNSLAMSFSSTGEWHGVGISFSGCDATSVLDGSNTGSATGANNVSMNVTTASNGTIVCDVVSNTRSYTSASVGAGQTERLKVDYNGGGDLFGSSTEVKTTAGTCAMSWSSSAGTGDWTQAGLGIKSGPVGPANVKTVDGLAIASVKTVNGLAIASVKTINGLN